MNMRIRQEQDITKMGLQSNGWTDAEERLLADEVEKSRLNGRPLRSVFTAVAQATGRQPNSVRNHYYLKAKSDGAYSAHTGISFVPFTDEEVESLLETVLTAVASGESVRSCTLRMGNGDNKAMLRYQNKYRSILKKNPELIARVASRLKLDGVSIRSLYLGKRQSNGSTNTEIQKAVSSALKSMDRLTGTGAEAFFNGIAKLAESALNQSEAEDTEALKNRILLLENEYKLHDAKLKRMCTMFRGLIEINYGFLNRTGVSKLSSLSEYINALSAMVGDCQQLLAEIKDERLAVLSNEASVSM